MTTLKTVSMYLRAAKTEAEEAGESTEGMASSVSELREEILALTGNRVDIMIDRNNFKSTYQILKELSDVWGSLTDVSQANILELTAGKRNSNVMSALLENFSLAEDVLATSANASGSALEENEKYLESINGKIAIMKASFETLSNTIINSDLVGFFADTATFVLNIANSLAEINALLPTILTTVSLLRGRSTFNKRQSGIHSFFSDFDNGVSEDDLVKSFLSMPSTQQSGVLNILSNSKIFEDADRISGDVESRLESLAVRLLDLNNVGNDTSGTIRGVADSASVLEGGFSSLKDKASAFIGGLSAFNKIQLAVAAVMALYNALKLLRKLAFSSSEDLYEEFDDLKTEYEATVDEIEAKTEEIQSNQERISELKDKLNSGTITFVEDSELSKLEAANKQLEYSLELKRKQQELDAEEANDTLLESYDKLKLSFADEDDSTVDAVRTLFERQISAWQSEYNKIIENGIEGKTAQEVEAELGRIQGIINKINEQNELLGASSYSVDDYVDLLVNARAELDAIREEQGGLTDDLLFQYRAVEKALESLYIRISDDYLQEFIGDGEGKDVFQVVLDRIQSILDPTGLIEQKIASLDSTIKTTLEDLGQEGSLTAEKIKELANSSTGLSAILTLLGGEESGAVKLVDYFNALHIASDATAQSVHEVYKKLVFLKSQLDTMPNGGKGTPESIEYNNLLHQASNYSTDLLGNSVTEVDPVYTASEKYYKIVDLIADAQEQMQSSGSITADTIKELSELADNYTDYLIVENGAIRLNTDALMEYANFDFSDKITDIEANISALTTAITIYQDRMKDGSGFSESGNDTRGEITEAREKIELLENQLVIYEAIQNSLSDKRGLDGLKEALGDTSTEFEKVDKILSKEGGFSNLSSLDFTNLISALPSIEAELISCAKAAENGNLSLEQQEALYSKIRSAAKALKNERIASTLEDIASAANGYGADSFQAQNAVETLRQYAPEVVAALYDEETGMYNLGAASEYSASAILAFAKIKISASIGTMIADLQRLTSAFQGVAISATVERILSSKQDEIDLAKSQLDELNTISTTVSSGGGGSSSTPVDTIKEAFDSLNASLEHSIYLQQQYYSNAEKNSDGTAMRNSLLKQIEFYKQIQEEAHKAADQLRAYYRSQGMSAETIEMQSDIQDLSKTWWEAANSIEEANKSIYDSVVQSFSDSVDEIQKVYDTLHEAADTYAESGYVTVDVLQEIVSMGVEYLAFLQNENGQLVINEENIQKIIAARTEQMAIETALSYVESLRAAQTAGNIEELNRLLYATQATSNATWGLVYANLGLLGLSSDQYNAALKNINSLRALANSAVQSIGKVAEKTSDTLKEMQDGVDDILKYVEDMIRHEIESQVDALEDLKDSYSELIELKKESLDASKNESEYTEQVAELTNKIAKIQSEIDLLDLVGTRESAAKKAALLEEQTELQKELSKLQGDYAYDAQIDALDKMEEAYHASKDDEIKALEDTISSEEKLYQLAIARIQSQWDTLYQQLIAWNTQNGSVINDEITSAWDSALAAAQRYGSFVSALKSLPGDIESAGSSGSSLVVGNTFNDVSYTNDEAIRSLIETMKANAVAWHSATKEQQDYLVQRNEAIAEQLRAFGLDIYKTSGGVWYLSDGRKLFDVYSYHTGGIVGGGTPKENEQFALLKDKEWVLNEAMVDSLMKKLSFFERAGSTISKITDAVSMIYRPGVGNLVLNNPVAQYALADGGRSVTVSIGDTYINGADESTVRKHQQINKQFMDDLATQLGVRW